jgi:UDP-D-galactose:(glucosyl)LPS alpha-1,6-D-galactosyltransferase
MEILVVVGTLSGLGGIEVCVRSLAEEAQANGDRVRVLALCPSVRDAKWHEGIAYSEVENGSTSLKRQMLRGLPVFIRTCKKQLPDAVVVIYSSTLLLVKLGLWIARLKRPVLAWLHFSTAHRQRTELLRLADGHLCISPQIADATKHVPGVRPEAVHLVYNGTRMDSVTPVPRSGQGPLRLLHVGRLMRGDQKRTDDLLRALAQVQADWQLDLIGSGSPETEVAELRSLAEQLGISNRMNWLGRQTEPWCAVREADALVLCSSYEGFPLVLIEAMARGIPCIASDCPSGPGDIVRPGENGWLFEVGDVRGLTERIQRLANDRTLLPSSDAVRESVQNFSSPRVFRRIREAIEHTVAD